MLRRKSYDSIGDVILASILVAMVIAGTIMLIQDCTRGVS